MGRELGRGGGLSRAPCSYRRPGPHKLHEDAVAVQHIGGAGKLRCQGRETGFYACQANANDCSAAPRPGGDSA